MASNSMFVNIIVIIIVLHLIVGFGFLVYKLSGKPPEQENQMESKNTTSEE